MHSSSNEKRLGVIAGNGIFPFQCIESASALGLDTVVAAHISETNPEIENIATNCLWVKIGQLGKIIRFFKSKGVTQVIFAGGIQRTKSFRGLPFDWRAIRMVSRMRSFGDDALLRAIANEFERDGMQVISAGEIVKDCVPKEGLLTSRDLSEQEIDNAVLGWEAAERLGSLDIGQTVITYKNLVLAIEAVEGTDACIERAGTLGKFAGTLAGGKGLVLVKRAKPQQDLRLDLPSVGVETIRRMQSAGVSAMVLQASHGVLLEPQKLIDLADSLGIAIRVVQDMQSYGKRTPKNQISMG